MSIGASVAMGTYLGYLAIEGAKRERRRVEAERGLEPPPRTRALVLWHRTSLYAFSIGYVGVGCFAGLLLGGAL